MTMASVATGPAYRVYPAPPPTVNNLSAKQKAQLRRTTTKLTKVLGAAPQVVDGCDGPIKVSLPMPLQKGQPSLSVYTGHKLHKRSKSTNDRTDPELYPLSVAARGTRRRPASDPPVSTRNRSRSFSVEPAHTTETQYNVPPIPQLRPQKEMNDARSSTYTRDSLCDSLYEPSFTIPSPIAIRREKMARVCKLLGEGVPVDLVFPPEEPTSEEDNFSVIDIRAPSPEPKEKDVPPPLPPKTDEWKRLCYRASNNSTSSASPMLSTIKEMSPRSSCSSTSSVDSDFSFVTSTTSSSYRFRRSSSMSPTSTAPTSHEHSPVSHAREPRQEDSIEQEKGKEETRSPFTSAYYSHPIHEVREAHERREFAVYVPYVPFFRRRSGLASSGFNDKRKTHEFDIIHGVPELRA